MCSYKKYESKAYRYVPKPLNKFSVGDLYTCVNRSVKSNKTQYMKNIKEESEVTKKVSEKTMFQTIY